MPRIAAAYIRVSTEDQTEYSPAAQLRELRAYAEAHGLQLDDRFVYADEGVSGRRAEKRPAFQRMISDAKAKLFSVVLVHKFDRFARSREDSVVYKAILKRAGVEVVSIREPLAEGSYSGVMEAIYESFAEAYSINLSQEVKKGMTEKALRGEVQTPPPFGYRMQEHRYVPDEEESTLVQELFRRCAAGEGCFSLARWLGTLHVTTHRGGAFESRTVEYILRNPVYLGRLRWNPAGRTRRQFDHSALIIAEAQHEPLISQELWDAVQRRLDERKARCPTRTRPPAGRKHWLSGIVRCAACGAALVCSGGYMKCSGYLRGRCRSSQHISAPVLESSLLAQLRQDLSAAEPIGFRPLPQLAADGTALEMARLRRAEQKLSRLTEAYLNGILTLEEYGSRRRMLEAERSPAVPELRQDPLTEEALYSALHTLTSPALEVEALYRAAAAVLERCEFDKRAGRLTLLYRFPG